MSSEAPESSRRSRGCKPDLHVALPKGRFSTDSRALVESLGGSLEAGTLRTELFGGSVAVYLLRAADIPRAVAVGYVDLAIASDDWLLEWEAAKGAGVERLFAGPRWLHMRMSFFARDPCEWPAADGVRVGTCFPALAQHLLVEHGCHSAEIMHLTGSTEAVVGDLVGVGFDCVETGQTLARHGLLEVFTPYPEIGMTVIRGARVPSTYGSFLSMLESCLSPEIAIGKPQRCRP